MELRPYPDSSFLVSLFRQDANSDLASSFMARAAKALHFTPLHRIEVRNALRNAVSRGIMAESDRRQAFRQMDEDLRTGLLVHIPVDWASALGRADELSEKHAAKDGQRTIDLLHVAIALECGAKTFLSFDNRQRSLASATGLTVVP